MPLKLISPLLVFALATFGVAPCFGMDMDAEMGAMRDRQCCEGHQCRDALDGSSSGPTVPVADCCALRTLPDPQVPIERTAAGPAASAVVDLVFPVAWRAPTSSAVLLTGPSPPLAAGVSRFLLLSVLLI